MAQPNPFRRLLSHLLPVLLLAALLAAPLPAGAQQDLPAPGNPVVPAAGASISSELAVLLASGQESVPFLVILNEQVDASAVAAQASAEYALTAASADDPFAEVQQVRRVLYAELTAVAQESQAPLRVWLEARGIPYRPHYIVNMLEVQGDGALAATLAARPDVARLVTNLPVAASLGAEPILHSRAPFHGWQTVAATEAQGSTDLPWGLVASGAPDVWALGYTGDGIVLASQDTGVDWQHAALLPRYRGWDDETLTASHAYNWYDAWGQDQIGPCAEPARPSAQIPCDDHGHGTHTVGTLLGDGTAQGYSVLGMAPDATWIACRNMQTGVGTPGSYTTCFEFFLAPWPQGGNPLADGKPDLAPDIINNSWGCPESEGCTDPTILQQVVETTRAAGQFVAASTGNLGPTCGSVRDPIAIYDASFSAGAYEEGGSIWYGSSRGPVMVDSSGRLKPDITAPGVNVFSTGPNNSYFSNQGTSMASPHVAGAVALLWSAAPELRGRVALSEHILARSATPMTGATCAPFDGAAVPNTTWGNGKLNALAAVQLALNPSTVRIRVAEPSLYARLLVLEPWAESPRWITPETDGEVLLPVYTLDWTGERTEVLTLTLAGDSSARLLDAQGRLLIDVTLYAPKAIFPVAGR